MLDVSIRMGLLNLLASLKRERGLAILLITHDLASARYLADRVLVLFRGRVVEDGPSDAVVNSPAHPYTRALLAAIADASAVEPAEDVTQPSTGSIRRAGTPVPMETGRGCPFASRCPEVREACLTEEPAPRPFDGRLVRCHLYPQSPRALGS
jgi:peptide/nickel transport system ATP-binding protein